MLPAEGHQAVYIIVASSTIGLPLLMFPIYWFRKNIKTLEMTERQERYIPLFIMAVFYFFSFHTLRNLSAPSLLSGYILGAFISVALAAVVNVWWKISLHGIGLGGIIALLTLIAFYRQGNPEGLFFQALIYSGIVLSARMYLNQHSLWQIVAGFACGFLSIFLTLLIY
jgi:membrane-associated phospholipid phosphatase